jgi:hypothetical protein
MEDRGSRVIHTSTRAYGALHKSSQTLEQQAQARGHPLVTRLRN